MHCWCRSSLLNARAFLDVCCAYRWSTAVYRKFPSVSQETGMLASLIIPPDVIWNIQGIIYVPFAWQYARVMHVIFDRFVVNSAGILKSLPFANWKSNRLRRVHKGMKVSRYPMDSLIFPSHLARRTFWPGFAPRWPAVTPLNRNHHFAGSLQLVTALDALSLDAGILFRKKIDLKAIRGSIYRRKCWI